MTKSTITRERLEKIKSWRETYGTGSNVMLPAEEAEELACLALAAMDSESVGTLSVRHMSYSGKKIGNQFGFVHSDAAMTIAEGDYPLYRHAQPAPVVPEEITIETATIIAYGLPTTNIGAIFKAGHDACRAAILQAEPVTAANKLGKSPVIPDGLPDGVNIYHGPKEKTILVLKQDAAVNQDCWCHTCRPVDLNDMRFVVCPDCGNKRCPRANDHRNACTGSNEPGQEGSAYPDAQQEVKGE